MIKYILALTLILGFSCTSPTVNEKTIRSQLKNSVVTVYGKTPSGYSSGGTGFVVVAPSGKKYLLTNKHVCKLRDSENNVTVRFPNLKRKYKRKIIEVSAEHDLCLVEGLPSMGRGLTVATSIVAGQTTFAVGHPKLYALTISKGQFIEEASIRVAMSKKPTVVTGEIKKSGSYVLNIKTFKSSRFVMYSRGGNSGSPIVDEQGDVISVLFAGNRADNMETYGVPLRFVQNFLAGY